MLNRIMIKRLTIFLTAVVALAAMVACNEKEKTDIEFSYSSTMVKSFKLNKNQKILNNLDTIFFSIDLENAKIFNADSLPYGTNVENLTVKLTTDICSVIEFHVTGKDGKTSVINYMKDEGDSINFANGPVKLHLVSYDGKAERDYTVSVNVHKMVPDSLYWNRLSSRRLPSQLSRPTAQKSVKAGDKAVVLTTDGTDYCVATTTDPAADQWEYSTPQFSFTPDVSSMATAGDAIYILDEAGELYRSTDFGTTWQSTGATWTSIFGSWQETLLGVAAGADGQYRHATYKHPEATTSSVVPADFPIKGCSGVAQFSTRWSTTPQVTMAGGRSANGELSSTVWGYDGKSWARLSTALPKKLAAPAMCAYEVAKTDTMSWKTNYVPALLIFGGVDEQGATNRDVYISRDFGVNWHKGDQNMQLPSYVNVGSDAQPLIFNSTYTSASPMSWRGYSPKALPQGWSVNPQLAAGTRVVKPITEWEAPFIYLFGGYDAAGGLYNTVWRGVINVLTFRPLY